MTEEGKDWTMPEWMEPYRGMIRNTGGNPVEELVNDHKTTAFSNVIRAGLIVAVTSQIHLLADLYSSGLLKNPEEESR